MIILKATGKGSTDGGNHDGRGKRDGKESTLTLTESHYLGPD